MDLLSAMVADMMLSFPLLVYERMSNRKDWSDVVAMKGAREVLRRVMYPDDATRRSLYASWLRVVASSRWQESFDHLMLECVAATPSPTAPRKPLFASIYRVRDVMDLPFPGVSQPVLNLHKIPTLFARNLEDVEPLPSSPGFVDFLADLIRKSRSSRAALNEAGLIIGFYNLALAVVAAKPVREVQDFFRTRMKSALASSVPTSFEGDVLVPSGRFLTELARKTYSAEGEVKPYIVLLVLGQYAYHVNASEAQPSADVRFLEEGFLTPAKFGHLDIIHLLYVVQEKTALSAKVLNRILRDSHSQEADLSSQRVREFLADADEPMQRTRPWCRTASVCFFLDLNLCDHVDYAMRLTAFVAPDPNDLLWQRPEFADVPAGRMKDARLWARNFKRALRKGKYGTGPRLDQ
ncbi:hypothetical protein HPB49_025199 [Dermacentor silvarum]|uniref:Uncharacterized protein n=1 Tax=Dermacentor silvarum TaxID=543639 RepID=A0ACB8C675_DERSI|nr:uncharacterized protein LOC119464282 [Dermacentor silvarum]KAH7934372.1 hypothetical protein HPB49_025199 [Dermacentor silvarum]